MRSCLWALFILVMFVIAGIGGFLYVLGGVWK